jgi:protein-S-isoprenylcysteine O-methyltransferase Ste14
MALQEELENQGNWLFKYRSFLPLIVLFVGLWIHYITESNPSQFILKKYLKEGNLEIFAALVGFIGLLIRVFTVGYTPKNTSGRNTKVGQVADTLNTSGIYATVRHPLYLGNFLMWLGPAILTGHLWFILTFVMFFWIYYERIMFAEEQFLRKKFDIQYLNWSQQTPAFTPLLTNYKRPKDNFNWKKVLKKEKNGLLALFIIFCVFDLVGEYVKNTTNYNWTLIVACIIIGAGYLILKFIKNKTDILKD